VKTFYSCILPIYNESPRISAILKILIEIKTINQIICVDDGSTDNSRQLISNEFPEVRVMAHKKNLGKAKAIKTGLSVSENKDIIILDSDLVNLYSDELKEALKIYKLKSLDCLIMRTRSVNPIDRFLKDIINTSLPFEGCRVVKKKIAERVFTEGLKCYQFEVLLNKYLINNNCKVRLMPISAYGISKAAKENIVTGVRKDMIMWNQILSTIGFLNFISQINWVRKIEGFSNKL